MASVDGLVSGLNTSDIIKQLMQMERQPQLRLQSRQSAAESAITALRTLNTKFLSLTTAAEGFGAVKVGATATAKPTDWQLTSATSSDATRVSASAAPGAAAGSLTFNVKQLAQAGSYMTNGAAYGSTADPFRTDGAVPPTTYTSLSLTKGGANPVTTVIDTGDGSLAATVTAINGANVGVTASAIQIADGSYQLHLSSTTTGAESAISLTDGGGNLVGSTQLVEPRNAELDLGGGVVLTRASNTVSDVLQGVTLTLTKADTHNGTSYDQPPVSVSVTNDAEGVAAKVAALVEAANAAMTEARSLTASDPVAKTKGRLYGDSAVRSLVDSVRTAISGTDAGPALAGVTTDRYGKVSFDKEKFLAALAADPAVVEAALGKDGLAGRLHQAADAASRSTTDANGAGVIAGAIANRESQIAGLKTNIERWDSRLAVREATLQRQYTALETALGKAQSQGQWLAGQLASLPSWS